MIDFKDTNAFIKALAEELKQVKEIEPPVWTPYVKTGAHKERPPVEKDWWYMRTAAILRSVYLLGPIGTSKLRTKYGGKKRRGYQPPEFRKGSGSIVRKCLQQLEKAGFIEKKAIGVHKGRSLTRKGNEFLKKAALSK